MAPLTRARAQTFPAYTSAWWLDHARATDLARAPAFGIECAVRFTRRRSTGKRWGGWHSWDGTEHRVHALVWPGQTVAHFLSIVAHELQHAWQAEQFGTPRGWEEAVASFWDEGASSLVEQARWDGERKNCPFEIDADRAAARLWPLLLPCIRLRTGGTR